jgi:hypothetical protein
MSRADEVRLVPSRDLRHGAALGFSVLAFALFALQPLLLWSENGQAELVQLDAVRKMNIDSNDGTVWAVRGDPFQNSGTTPFQRRAIRPVERFAVRNPEAFRARPTMMRVAPFRALYSASLGADPQSFLQKAPEQGKLGMFRGYMPPLRGEEGGTPEYKYTEEMLACPCAGVAGMCLSLFMDEEFDQGPQPCECNCT